MPILDGAKEPGGQNPMAVMPTRALLGYEKKGGGFVRFVGNRFREGSDDGASYRDARQQDSFCRDPDATRDTER